LVWNSSGDMLFSIVIFISLALCFLVGMCFSTPTLALHVFPLLHNKPLKDSVPGITLNIVYGLLLQWWNTRKTEILLTPSLCKP
jgi:hypothetical protein